MLLRELVAVMGLSVRFTGVRTIAPPGGEIARDHEAAFTHLAAACRLCAEEDVAAAVILGGAALAGLAERSRPKVPVFCSVAA